MSPRSRERTIVLATSNRGKIVEVSRLLADLPVRLSLLSDVVGSNPIPEPFATFRENALHKALKAAALSGSWALGEDSGLQVDALAGRPGVYSARFAGKGAPDEQRCRVLLDMLVGAPPERRTARFTCAIALASPQRVLGEWQGQCEGRITEAPRGKAGFGFDPVFEPLGRSRTAAEMSTDEKNAISHRGQALRRLAADLPRILE